MGCGCNKEKPKGGGKSFTKAVVEIVNPEKITLLRKVVIPASLGDETTIPPAVGLYRNVVLCYEASKRVYLYSSDGIPTFISTDLDAIEDELERLGVAIEDETSAREQADEELGRSISALSDALDEETLARISSDDQINDTVSAHTLQISELSTGLNNEIGNRRNADTDLQSQIDAISASSDVKDIVGTHAELENYDTTSLGNNDIIKVLQDETQNGATTYYRWSTTTQEFTLIGEEGPYYTKSQTDSLLTGKQNTLTAGNNIAITGDTISATDTTYSAGNGLSLSGTTFSADTTILQPKLTAGDNISITNNTISATDTKYTAGSGLDLTGTEFSVDNTVALKTDLPTVNNAIFTLQKNGSDVASFTANSAVDVTANITVPTDTAQLTNTAGYQTASDVASAISGKQDTLTPGNNIQINGSTISATNTTYSAGNGLDLTGTVFSADTDILQTKLTPGTNITIQDGVISSSGGTYTAGNGLELTNNEFSIDDSIVALKSDIPVISSASLTIQRNGTDVATFTTDSPNPVTANILVPTNNAQLINGAGYQTASDVQSLISGKQDTLTPGNNIQISGNTISATDTKYSAGNGLNLTGTVFTADTDILATKSYVDSVIPEDMVVLSYGSSTWNDFITAYNDNRVVYCRASSNADPSTGSQTRLAFMAYVNNGTNPTSVEFQYYRSVSSHSDSQQGDQVYVYKLESNGTWTVTVRNAFSKVVAGDNMTSSYVNGAITLDATVPTNVSELNNDAGYLTSVSWGEVSGKPTFATVATSGSYNDLTNKPTIPAAQVNSDWNATGGVAEILNKPTIPTKTSDLTNDSGYITDAGVTSFNGQTGAVTYTAPVTSVNGSTGDVTISVPTKTSDLINDGSDNTAQYLETDETAYKTTSIPYGQCDSTSTSTEFTATVSGITELRDGVCMWLKNGVVTSVSGFTININNLGAKPVYNNMAAATRDTTIWNINYTMFFVYDSTRVEGGCWILYRGYNSDNNTIGYQLRTNSISLTTTDRTRYYRLLFTSADNTHWVPANTQYDNSATSNKTVNQRKINPFGRIVYLGNSTSYLADAAVSATAVWDQYALNLGYSFAKGSALTMTFPKPVYVKCAPQTDGSAIIDSTTPYVQDLPSTDDGKIYIYLGVAYSATNVEMVINHPIYYYKDGAIREWTNAAASIASVAWGDITGTLSSQTDLNTALGAKANSADLAAVATSGSYNDLTNKPTIPAAQVNSDWNSNSGVSQILNKPTLATVATSGSYNDLSNKPTIPTVPTNVSAFTNDAGYQNSTQVQTAINSAISGITGFEYQVVQALPATGEKGVIYLVPNSGSAPNIYDEYIWIESGQSGSFEKIGTTETDLSGYVTDGELQTALADYTTTEDLATVATSGSYNDLSNKPTIPAAQVNSDWNANSGVAQILNKPTLATVATSGSYNDLSNKPTIPTVNNATLTIQKNGTTVNTFTANASSNVTANITVPTATSDLTNDSGFITGVAWGDVTGKPTFATVATTGSYDDLEDKPTIPAAQVNSDWNATSGVAQILNKPTIPTVPTAGTTASAVSTTASGGSATTWSKSDHVHSISSSTITSALGYTPYNSTNPNGYTSNTGTITGVSANGTSVATSGVANIPAASTSRYGVTQLSSATNSSSTSLAATASAVKAAYDLADGKQDPLTAGTGIDITNGVISATAVANTFASYQNGTLYITNSAQNADTENF